MLELNRNTINHWFGIFRQKIYEHQTNQKRLLYGEIELDESYFGAKRQRDFHGKLKRARGALKPVFGILERDRQVYTKNCTRLHQSNLTSCDTW